MNYGTNAGRTFGVFEETFFDYLEHETHDQSLNTSHTLKYLAIFIA
jgi:hypothetical protein